MDINDSVPTNPTNRDNTVIGPHAAGLASIRRSYDVVVVGARAAGAATAMLLARRGVSVLAVDRGEYGSDTLSTHSIALPGVMQLSRWRLLDAIRDAGTPVTRRIEFLYGDESVAIELPPRGDVDGLYSPRRTLLDRVLVDAAVDAGADVRHGVSMVALTHDQCGRVAGVQLDVDGQLIEVGARFVVGADGMRSRVAKQVGARAIHAEPAGAASIYTYYRGIPDDSIVNSYRPGAVAGVIPTNDGAAVVWAGVDPARFRSEGRGRLAELHADVLAGAPAVADLVAGAERVGGFRGFPGTGGFLRDGYGDGWALVGDAAYFKDPVSAHGITDALIGAELVADALAAGLDDPCVEAEALADFQATRDEMARQMMPAVAAAAALPSDMRVLQQAFKGMAAAMRHEGGVIAERWGVGAAV